MINERTVLVIDAGNTSIKIGVFKSDILTETQRFNIDSEEKIIHFLNKFESYGSILSSVLTISQTKSLANLFSNCIILDKDFYYPITFNYKTPLSLGMDRVCNAVASNYLAPDSNVLSIDVGTCIKFDFVDSNNCYQGGSIAPGINLRYKSLNDYTANLPLLNERNKISLIGKSTTESIQSGILNGIQAEIIHLMHRYSEEIGDLTFFMTGGDIHYFDFPRKNNIFVDENLTLIGLYQIYLLNAH